MDPCGTFSARYIFEMFVRLITFDDQTGPAQPRCRPTGRVSLADLRSRRRRSKRRARAAGFTFG
jgi:hypothetical protein